MPKSTIETISQVNVSIKGVTCRKSAPWAYPCKATLGWFYFVSVVEFTHVIFFCLSTNLEETSNKVFLDLHKFLFDHILVFCMEILKLGYRSSLFGCGKLIVTKSIRISKNASVWPKCLKLHFKSIELI